MGGKLTASQPKPSPYPSVYWMPLISPGTTISPRRIGTCSTYNLQSWAAWGIYSWNSLRSFLSSKVSYGFFVQSVSSQYPVHLARYKTLFHYLLNWLHMISSTTYPVWYSYHSTSYPKSSSSVTIASRSVESQIRLLPMRKGSIQDTLKTLHICHHEGNSNLSAVDDITFHRQNVF